MEPYINGGPANRGSSLADTAINTGSRPVSFCNSADLPADSCCKLTVGVRVYALYCTPYKLVKVIGTQAAIPYNP